MRSQLVLIALGPLCYLLGAAIGRSFSIGGALIDVSPGPIVGGILGVIVGSFLRHSKLERVAVIYSVLLAIGLAALVAFFVLQTRQSPPRAVGLLVIAGVTLGLPGLAGVLGSWLAYRHHRRHDRLSARAAGTTPRPRPD